MILVIDKTKRTAENLSDMLYYMGILSRPVTPDEAASEEHPRARAIIVTSPDALTAIRELTAKLKNYSGAIPIFGVGAEGADFLAGLFPVGAFAAEMASGIKRYCTQAGLSAPGDYALGDIDASADLPLATYRGAPLPFTKTELMIVRALILEHPSPLTTEKILERAYRPQRVPSASNIRTHVSSINKKFKRLTGRNLIFPTFGEGYGICAERTDKELLTV